MNERALLEVEIITLFPELFDSFLKASLLGKAIEAGLVTVERTNPRDFAPGRHRSVDDTPYGGGPGMILRVEPVVAAIEHVEQQRGRAHRVLLSPSGKLFDQNMVVELVSRRRLLLVCGRYEGVDERVATLLADDVVSIGDYVLSGGEIAAAVMIEAVARLIPGVLGCEASTADESFAKGRLEYPQWTRPAEFRGEKVPDVLLSGDHQAIDRWRRREALRRTVTRRPDLLQKHSLSDEEQRIVAADLDEDARAGREKNPRRS